MDKTKTNQIRRSEVFLFNRWHEITSIDTSRNRYLEKLGILRPLTANITAPILESKQISRTKIKICHNCTEISDSTQHSPASVMSMMTDNKK